MLLPLLNEEFLRRHQIRVLYVFNFKDPVMLTSLRGKIIFIFILITVTTVMISSGYARYQQREFVLDRARERAMVDIERISSDIRSLQQWVQRDLLVLRDLPSLQAFLNCTGQDKKTQILTILQKDFHNIAAHHQVFQQVRLLDSSGMEIVRANFPVTGVLFTASTTSLGICPTRPGEKVMVSKVCLRVLLKKMTIFIPS